MSINYQKTVSIKYKKNYKVNIEVYNSAQEVVNDCKTRPITSSSFQDEALESFGSFEGVASYDEALDLLANGYQPTVERMKEKAKLNKQGIKKRINFQNEVAGFAPIVPLALKGIPQNMLNMTMKQIKQKVIDVYYDMTCSCDVKSEDIINNGQKMLGVILDLEAQGYRFNLYGMQAYTDCNSSDILCVKIKDANQPIDLKRISFPLTHTAFFRVIGFDWYSKTPKGHYRSGYGHTLAREFSTEDTKSFINQLFGNNALYFSGTRILNQSEDYLKGEIQNAR